MCLRWKLLWPVLLLILLPLLAAWFAYPEMHLPKGFGTFPQAQVQAAPGFNLLAFIIIAAISLLIITLIIFPGWFGFKSTGQETANNSMQVKLPIWFWIGLATTAFFWWLMWSRETLFGDLVYYAFTPLWWGFIILLDGLVYARNNGKSLLSKRPGLLLFSALFSIVGWGFFEYYNYFIYENWYYPYDSDAFPNLNHTAIVIIFLIAYTTVWPAIFEWYTLLATWPKFVARYSQGPKVKLPANILIGSGLVLSIFMVFFPYPLFWAIWVAPLAVFSGILLRQGIASPFSDMANGNWSPAVLISLSSLLNGFFWELWNYGSAHPETPISNPNYWIYDVPYVNVIHLFSDMPLLGYIGYVPFGLLVMVMFIWAGRLFNVNTQLR